MKIEFYVLASAAPAERERVACQLAMKAWRAGLPVFLRASDAAQCKTLDELLWRFKGETFVPHNLYDDDSSAPVLIGLDQPPHASNGLLINLHPQLREDLTLFSRVIEIVNQHPEQLQLARDNFRLYRQRGFAPQRVEL